MAQDLKFSQTAFERTLYMAKVGLNKTSVCKLAGTRGFYWTEEESPVISIYCNEHGKYVPVTSTDKERAEYDAVSVGQQGELIKRVYYKDMENWKRIGLDDMTEFAEHFVTSSVAGQRTVQTPVVE